MKPFAHVNATSVAEAIGLMSDHKEGARFMAGGTDLLGLLKTRAAAVYPDLLINLKTIPDLKGIALDGEGLTLGPLTPLADISASPQIQASYPILAAAAESVGFPQIRHMGTVGGNLAQETRCWYYRYPNAIGGRISCRKKGEGPCLAVQGDNRYHALFGAKKCFAVCPSDMAVALAALDAVITMTGPQGERSVAVPDFYHPLGNALSPSEIITRIHVPKPAADNRQVFIKHRVRDAIDFAIVSVAVSMTIGPETCTEARIVLGAVAPGPYRAGQAEAVLIGNAVTAETAEAAATAATIGAVPLSGNAYKIELVKALVKRAVLSA